MTLCMSVWFSESKSSANLFVILPLRMVLVLAFYIIYELENEINWMIFVEEINMILFILFRVNVFSIRIYDVAP